MHLNACRTNIISVPEFNSAVALVIYKQLQLNMQKKKYPKENPKLARLTCVNMHNSVP